jgi:hypothetical protein
MENQELRGQKICRIFEAFDSNRDGGLSKVPALLLCFHG